MFLNCLDIVGTLYEQAMDIPEANPLMHLVLHHGLWVFALAKLSIAVALVSVLWRYAPVSRLANIGLWLVVVVYGVVAVVHVVILWGG